MLQYFYQWRYHRAQRASSFKLPPEQRKDGRPLLNLGNYLAQTSVRGRSLTQFDRPRKRRLRRRRLALVLVALAISWVVYESALALMLLHN